MAPVGRAILATIGGLMLAVGVLLSVVPTGDGCSGPARWFLYDTFNSDADLERLVASACRSATLERANLALLIGGPGAIMVAVASAATAVENARARERERSAEMLTARQVDGGWWVWHGARGWAFHRDPPSQ